MLLEMKGSKYQGTGSQAPWLGELPALKFSAPPVRPYDSTTYAPIR